MLVDFANAGTMKQEVKSKFYKCKTFRFLVTESAKVEYDPPSMNEFIKHPTVEEFKNAVKSSYYKRKRTKEGKLK